MAEKEKKESTAEGTESTHSTPPPSSSAGVKRLYRSISDRYIAGVCGGVAEYFEIDPSLVRILWAISVFMGGLGVIAYIAGWIIMPENPEPSVPVRTEAASNFGLIAGIFLIGLGVVLLANQFHLRYMFPWGFNIFDSGVLISLLIIGAGLYFIFHKSGETHLEKPSETTAAPAGERARKLTRSVTDRKIAGVCGGLAKYFNIDSSIVRIVFVVLTVAAFYLTIIAYIVMAIVVPEEENEQAYTPPGQSAS